MSLWKNPSRSFFFFEPSTIGIYHLYLAYTCGYFEAVDSVVGSSPLESVGAHATFAVKKQS